MNVDLFEWFCSTLEPQVSNANTVPKPAPSFLAQYYQRSDDEHDHSGQPLSVTSRLSSPIDLSATQSERFYYLTHYILDSLVTPDNLNPGALEALLNDTRNCRVLRPFNTIVNTIAAEKCSGALAVFVFHKTLPNVSAQLAQGGLIEWDNLLVFERFPFQIERSHLIFLQDLKSDPKEQYLRKDWSSYDSLSSDYVRLYFNGTYKTLAATILRILHYFFVTTELDGFLYHSAERFVLDEIRSAAIQTLRYDHLLNINLKHFRA